MRRSARHDGDHEGGVHQTPALKLHPLGVSVRIVSLESLRDQATCGGASFALE